MQWKISKPDNFERKQVRLLPKSAARKLQSVMVDMLHSNDPRQFGIWKDTKHGPAYVADLNDSYRLAYRIDNDTIIIIKVGDHKEVYGKD